MNVSLRSQTAAILAEVRTRRPRVHCITNNAVQAFTANMLLAAGAIPSMTTSPDEIGYFVSGADALLVNLGTFDRERAEAVDIALDIARDEGVPWLLDPVMVDRSEPRAKQARALALKEPRIVRANAGEFSVLAGTDDVSSAVLDRFALDHLTVAACTGTSDYVTNGSRHARIDNGHEWMSAVTGVGCAESALIAAMMAVEDDEFAAAAAGLLSMGVAGENAAARATGPGSFAVALIDALAALDAATIEEKARFE